GRPRGHLRPQRQRLGDAAPACEAAGQPAGPRHAGPRAADQVPDVAPPPAGRSQQGLPQVLRKSGQGRAVEGRRRKTPALPFGDCLTRTLSEPPPLTGEAASEASGGGGAVAVFACSATPHPSPPPQGGRE